jgi:hypothetical protein
MDSTRIDALHLGSVHKDDSSSVASAYPNVVDQADTIDRRAPGTTAPHSRAYQGVAAVGE